ncbi:MAG TPA: sucrase/ferredoxin-like family protein [Gemmatimonadota bacterium]|nr:sucrase/ferredoxin-like family protein [Gemmatimonadota bacterium]
MSRQRGEWPLPGTVKPYHRHTFVCTGESSWPPRLEEADGLLGRMARDVRALRAGDEAAPKLTATDEAPEGAGCDLLIFPEGVRYSGVDGATWPGILRDHIQGGRISAAVPHRLLSGLHIFVCIHANRDERCGRCGPPVRRAIEAACATEDLVHVTVRATSHVGGHKYAANVLVYPEGVWYGYVRPEDADRIVREHLKERRIVEDLWRGSMAPARPGP